MKIIFLNKKYFWLFFFLVFFSEFCAAVDEKKVYKSLNFCSGGYVDLLNVNKFSKINNAIYYDYGKIVKVDFYKDVVLELSCHIEVVNDSIDIYFLGLKPIDGDYSDIIFDMYRDKKNEIFIEGVKPVVIKLQYKNKIWKIIN